MFLFHTLSKHCSHTVLTDNNQSAPSGTPSADKNLVTTCFSSLVQTEFSGHVTSAGTTLHWPFKFKMAEGSRWYWHAQWTAQPVQQNFTKYFTTLSESLMYLINKYRSHINSRLRWCNSIYQNLNWVPFFLPETYGSQELKTLHSQSTNMSTVNYQ